MLLGPPQMMLVVKKKEISFILIKLLLMPWDGPLRKELIARSEMKSVKS